MALSPKNMKDHELARNIVYYEDYIKKAKENKRSFSATEKILRELKKELSSRNK